MVQQYECQTRNQDSEQAYNPATDVLFSQQTDNLLRPHDETRHKKGLKMAPRTLSIFGSPPQCVRVMQSAAKAAQINADKSTIVRLDHRTVCTAELATAARSRPSCGKIENHRLSASSDSNRVVEKVQCFIERKVNDVRPRGNELKKRVHRPR